MSVYLSVRLFVTLVSHADTVRDIEILFTPHNKAMFLVFLLQNFAVRTYGFTGNKCVKEKFSPVQSEHLTSNLQ